MRRKEPSFYKLFKQDRLDPKSVEIIKKAFNEGDDGLTPIVVLKVIDLIFKDKILEKDLDYIWYCLESKGIDVKNKDLVSASISFYHNPVLFFENVHVFDKTAIAFNNGSVNIHRPFLKPSPMQIVWASICADNVIKFMLKKEEGDFKFSDDVATYIAAIFHDKGFAVIPPKYGEKFKDVDKILSNINHNITEKIKEEILSKYDKSPLDLGSETITADNYIDMNIINFYIIDLYINNMSIKENILVDSILSPIIK